MTHGEHLPQENREEVESHKLRWWILLLLFLSITINILDRQVLSIVAPVLRDNFGFSNTQYAFIVFCFLLGMTTGQIPVGMMMDRKGARFGFTLIMAWWSTANLLHAFARSLTMFSGLRFFLGLGECGTYSGAVKVLGQWFPSKERALAAGIFNSGSLLGAIVAPPLIVFLMLKFGWRAAFFLPSLVGFLWLIPWLMIYWEPWRHPRLWAGRGHQAQAKLPGSKVTINPPLIPLLGVPTVWGVILMRALAGPVTHFYWYWLPEYLKRERHMSMAMIGLVAWLPFFTGGLGNIGGGWFSSWLVRRGWTVDRARKTAFTTAVALCLAAVLVPIVPRAAWAIVLICVASLGINAFAANLISILTDLFPEPILAKVSGLTGVGDGIMSMTMMLLAGVIIDRHSYAWVFTGAAVLPVSALAALFLLVGKIRPIGLTEIYGQQMGKERM
jgi:ACS family hexuronate transporter-like MFS transporter